MGTKCDLDAKKFDLLTITAADYAVSLPISRQMYQEFNKNYKSYLEKYDGSIGEAWIKFLTEKTEEILQRFVDS